MVARCSRETWDDAPGVAAQAQTISDRALALARADAVAWEEALAALREAEAGGVSDDRRDFTLERKLEHAAAVPIEITELGATAAELAALAAENGDAEYRADAASAAALAAGATRAAGLLVEINLTVREGESRLTRTRLNEQAASDAADRALAAVR